MQVWDVSERYNKAGQTSEVLLLGRLQSTEATVCVRVVNTPVTITLATGLAHVEAHLEEGIEDALNQHLLYKLKTDEWRSRWRCSRTGCTTCATDRVFSLNTGPCVHDMRTLCVQNGHHPVLGVRRIFRKTIVGYQPAPTVCFEFQLRDAFFLTETFNYLVKKIDELHWTLTAEVCGAYSGNNSDTFLYASDLLDKAPQQKADPIAVFSWVAGFDTKGRAVEVAGRVSSCAHEYVVDFANLEILKNCEA